MDIPSGARSKALAVRLHRASADLIAVVDRIDDRHWHAPPRPGVWSIGKEAEHVADAAVYHEWIVRLTMGEKVSPRRPGIERARMTSDRSRAEVVALIRERADAGARLLTGLTDEQLDRPTRPARARDQRLAETIELVLIGHYDVHRHEIEAKFAAAKNGC